MALLEERRKKLAAEGLFAAERKRPLPYLPRVIGVITSPTGAVIRDILHRLSDRFPVHVLVWPVRVQGETTAAEVSAALAGFNHLPPDGAVIPRPDLLIVARGGGSIEDLWGFNEELVVRAVAASRIPVITAVGHETDTTLVDYASDHRAPTPTAAAEAAVPVRAELIGYVDDLGGRTRHAMRRIGGAARDRLRAASAGLPRPTDIVGGARQRLDQAAAGLVSALRHAGQLKRIELAQCAGRLTPAMLTRRAETLGSRLADLDRRLEAAVSRGVERRRGAFTSLAGRLSGRILVAELRHNRTRLDPVARRLLPCVRTRLASETQRLAELWRLLESYSYERVLDRGFAIVTDDRGGIVRASAQVRPGQSLNVRVARDDFGVSVTGAPIWPRKRTRQTPEDSGQTSLF
jgi:exodeoxyribonuclease VII large subunit